MTSMDEEVEGMGSGPWNMKTIHGYAADQAVSALQKEIRRADSDGAVWWAHELNMSGLGAWVWRRLFIITSEDIGLAEPDAPAVMNGLYQMSQVLLANQRKPEQGKPTVYPILQVLQAAWYLSRCPKNREVADLCGVLDFKHQMRDLRPIPDVALDQHTAAGRAMGRGALHFEDQTEAGGRWCKDEVEVDNNRWRKLFYSLWKVPNDPASRSYGVLDPVAQSQSDRPPE